jgi:serine protease Do
MASSPARTGPLLALSVVLSVVITTVVLGAALVGTGMVDLRHLAPPTRLSSTTTPAPVTPQPAVLARDELVVSTVKRVSPAVVSIVISRNLPQAQAQGDASPFLNPSDPFGDLFRQLQPSATPAPGAAPQKQQIGGGSGFFVSADGLILTNKHVVSFENVEYTVVLNDGKELPAKVLARDPSNDLALMKVDGSGYPALTLGDSNTLQPGQTVIAIGNALGEFQNTVSVGVVSGLARSITAGGAGFVERLEGVLQTDAAINPGNSGGPLLNLQGEVVGINTAVAQGALSIGFAIVVYDAKQDIESVRKTGKIIRAFLGVRYVAVNQQLQQEQKLPVSEGALVQGGEAGSPAVVAGSPADKAGLHEGDIIVEVDGEQVTLDQPLWRLIGGKSVGDAVKLVVISKDGKRRTVDVKLEAQPETTPPPQ